VVIVIVTRSQLCNESLMADEAFALSPIAARPVMPSDADYDAIREAFMETSRGRWFLNEYGKRNRNSDTSMVLDAVSRIEQTLAAQKQAHANAATESLSAIRAMIGEARAGVAKAIAGLDDTATLAAAQRGARVIHEVAATLRECGADSRICDLLDQQVEAIQLAQRRIADIDRSAIDAAFDLMVGRIAGLYGGSGAAQAGPAPSAAAAPANSQPAAAPPASAAPAAAPAATAEPAAAMQAPAETGIVIVSALERDELEFVESADTAASAAGSPAAAAPAPSPDPAMEFAGADEAVAAELGRSWAEDDAEHLLEEVVALDAETMAEDDAMLDLVAREMSAPDVSAPYPDDEAEPDARSQPADQIDSDIAAIQQALSEAVDEPAMADEAAPFGVDAAPAQDASFETEVAPDEVMLQPTAGEPVPAVAAAQASAVAATSAAVAASAAAPSSLGAAALASGAVSAPSIVRSDALVPIRRMTQAEKVAFFS